VIYLSSTDLAILHAEFGRAVYATLSDAQRFAYLSVPEGTVANPIAQGQVPVVIDRLKPDGEPQRHHKQ